MDKLDKTVPANPEAEEAVLGSLLIDPDAVLKVASFLEDDDFYRERNGWIYRAILDLHERREPADFVTLCDELERRDILQEVGGAAYITQLINNVPSAAYVEHYGHIVERTAILRRLIDAAGQVAALAYEEAQDVDEVVDRAEQIIFNVAERRVKRDLVPVRQVMHQVVDRIEYLHRHQGQILGVPSGFTQLDRLLGGFQKSDLIILAARPAVGKCIVSGSRLLDPDTGALVTIDQIVHRRRGRLLTLNARYKFEPASPADFVDDGVKPVYRVRTKLGREIHTTASHPFLTYQGWQPLAGLAVGQRIAVPRALPYFGAGIVPEGQLKVLAYLLADGCLTHTMPGFTNENPLLRADFAASLADFVGATSVTRDSNGDRTPTVFAIGCDEFIERERAAFAGRLRTAVETYPNTARHLAAHLGVSPALVSLWQSGACVPNADAFDRLCLELDMPADALAPHGRDILSKDDRNSVTRWMQELGLWGCNSHEKFVPDFVFALERPLVALFLNRLFACDGSIYHSKGENNPQISYSSVSLTLAREVQHLLLRFGVIAQLRHRQVSYKGEKRTAYELVVTGKRDVLTFLDEIGAYGKEAQAASARAALAAIEPQDDTIPIEVWGEIVRSKGARSWREVSAGLGYPASNNFHVGKRAPGRKRLAEFARAFDDEKLRDLAESDVHWDTIESIEYVGQRQVYDLTVGGTHNFVAEDMLVHNTSLSLNFALNAARKFRKVVAYFSLEMSAEQLVQRLLAMETGIDQQRLRKGEIEDHDWDMLMAAAGELAGTMLYIDDTPAMSALELRTKARRLQAEHGLDLIVVDYLQLMRGDNRSENRVQEISYISRALKGLARELEAPVIALSQLSRAVESRTDHKPMLSDLRESGCLTGETLVTLAETGRRVPIRDLAGKSGFAIWGLEENCLQLHAAPVSNAFSTGIKPVFKLTTRLGRTIRATANHPFRVLFGWRRLDQINVGERIAVPRLMQSGHDNPLSLDQVALLGHLIGDGCALPRHAMQYTTNDQELADIVMALTSRVFGEAINTRMNYERRWIQVYLSSAEQLTHRKRNPLAEWLDGLGIFGLRSSEKRVPAELFACDEERIGIFLRHLWSTDGCVYMPPAETKRPPSIYYASSSPTLARDVQALLLRLRINAVVRPSDQGTKGKPQWHVMVMGKTDTLAFADKVGAVGTRRTEALRAIVEHVSGREENTNRDVVPNAIWRGLVTPLMAEQTVTSRQLQARIGMRYMGTGLYKQNLSRERMSRLAHALADDPRLVALATGDVYWDEVVSIEPDGEEEVFDLTVPALGNFVANDIIVHNSIEQDSDIVMFIYREDLHKENSDKKNIADIIVAKHRNGPTDTIPLYFRKELTKFENLEMVREPLNE